MNNETFSRAIIDLQRADQGWNTQDINGVLYRTNTLRPVANGR